MTPVEAADVSIVVVNYNGEAGLARCVESLAQDTGPRHEILLVDNASTDASAGVARALAERLESVELFENDANLGYAAAVNAVLDRCRGRYVAVLNMDLRAEPGWLGPLVAFLDANPQVAAVNPLVTLDDGETVNAAGQNVHVSGLGFNRDLGRARAELGDDPFPVSGIQGAAFLVRRALLVEMGGMDPHGFLYHEDVNLSWLLRIMGHALYCVPAGAVHHDYALSMHAEKLFLLERNRLALVYTHMQPLTRLRVLPWLLATEVMLWAYALLRGPAFLAAKARSYASLFSLGARLRARRSQIEGLRRVDDRVVLAELEWRYAWRQFGTLARERGAPRRPIEVGADDDAAA